MEQLMLAGLGHEHDGPDAADLHCGLVAELDEALGTTVQVGKVSDMSCHVVHGTAVEVPSPALVVIGAVTEEGSRPRLVDVEQGRRGERRHGVGVRGSSIFTLALFSSGTQH
jgi:phosphoribosylformylglycinamidine (FGAM) synthase-like enzyme